MGLRIDMVGQQFGRLRVIEFADTTRGRARWICACKCGKTKVIKGKNLRSGNTRSCGCLHHEAIKTSQRTHGLSRSGTWWSWTAMKQRCYNTRSISYPYYGGQGIRVCSRWLNSFENFLEDMGEKPTEAHTIDRYPDQSGNYEKSNCRWATKKQQANNRKNNR